MCGTFTSLLSLFVSLTYLCPTASYLITHIEKLQKTTCEAVYERALDSKNDINFSKAIGNLSCSPGPNGFIRYHCMVNEDGHNIQFCAEWIWIESGLCPRLYSLQGIINPKECGGDGCPTDKYQSHMYYKYSACFVKEHSKNGTAKHNTPSTNNKSSDLTVVVVVVLLLVLILAPATAGIVFYIVRRQRNGTKDQTDTWESPLLAAYNFRQTRPFESMEECVKQKSHIVLTGLPGSGVSTLLEQMRDSHQGKKWHTEKHGELHFESRDAQFIVFDHSGLQKLIRNHSVEDISVEMAQVQGKTTVIINVDYEWYTESPDMIQRCLGKTYTMIDLSSEKYRLKNLEKRRYLDDLCNKNGITEDELPEEKRQVIASFKESSKGFLLLCSDLINSRNFDNPEAYLRTKDSRKSTTEKFLQRKAFEAMEDCIKEKRHIVLTGKPGSGVSTLMEQIRDSHQGKKWHQEKHGELYFKSRDAEFVVFDHSGLLNVLSKYSAEDISKEMMQVLGKKTVIINIDYDWYTKFPETISQCLGKMYKVIDLSSEKYRLNKLEKRQYLDFLCEKNSITEETLPEEKRQVIASYKESNKGFLLLCLDLINRRAFDHPDAYFRMKDLKKDVLEQDRPLNAAKSKLDTGRHVLVTGLPGSGTSTFLEHLKGKCPNWEKVKYKTLRFNRNGKGVVEIGHDIVKDLMKSDELNKLKDRIFHAPGCAFIMSVKYEWYRKYADEFREKLEIPFDVIDLSSDEYKLNNEEKLAIVDKLCSEKCISLEQLSIEKRQEISSFDGSYCGFLQVFKEFLEEEEFENPIKRMEWIDEQHKK